MKSKQLARTFFQKKFRKTFVLVRTKKCWPFRTYFKQNMKFPNWNYQTVVQVTISIKNRRNELLRQQIKLIPTSFQSNVHYRVVVVRFSATLVDHVFLLCIRLPVGFFFHLNNSIEKQVAALTFYFSCIIHLHKYFFATFVIFLSCLFPINTYYEENALFSNSIELKYSGNVFEAVQI